MELSTEGVDALDCTQEDTQIALDYLDGVDGVVLDDLSDGARHVAFVVEEKLGWAEGVAESYAGRQYSLPVRDAGGATPREFVSAILSIGRHKMYSRRASMPDEVQEDYNQAIAWLTRLADGSVVVNTGTAGTSVISARGSSGLTDRTNVSFGSSVY